MTIILCGFKNCGKSSVGACLGKLLRMPFFDIDDLLLSRYSEQYEKHGSISEIHHSLGDKRFRQLESEVVQSLNTDSEKMIISTGGGTLLDKNNIIHLKKLGKVVYLQTQLEDIEDRILEQDILPSFLDEENFQNDFMRYVDKRQHIFESEADFIIDCSGLSIEEVSGKIKDLIFV